MEEMERCQKEDSRLQLGAEIVEAIWHHNDRLASIKGELAASWEAAVEGVKAPLSIIDLKSLVHQLGAREQEGARRGRVRG